MAWIQRVQKRVTVTANMLGDIKTVKMLGVMDNLSNMIQELRKEELKGSEKFRKLLVSVIMLVV